MQWQCKFIMTWHLAHFRQFSERIFLLTFNEEASPVSFSFHPLLGISELNQVVSLVSA